MTASAALPVTYPLTMDQPERASSASLITPELAVEELSGGRAVTLRHRTGFSLVAPAALASAPLVAELEATAGSPISLAVAAGTLAGDGGELALAGGDPRTRAAAVRDVIGGRRPARSAGLAVIEAAPALRDGSAASSALDLVNAAGFEGGAILAPVADDRSEAARVGELGLGIVCVSDLAGYVSGLQSPVERVVSTGLPTPYGEFEMIGYRAPLQDMEFLVAVRGECAGQPGVPVSVHDGCVFGEALRGAACDCRARWLAAWEHIGGEPRGIVIRLEPDPSVLLDHGGTPDPCRIALAVQVIRDLDPASVRLIETDPALASALIDHGCQVVD